MRLRNCIVLGLVMCIAGRADAQAAGIPVVNNGAPTGIVVGADVGFVNQDYGGGNAIGARAAVGLGFFGVGAVLSRYSPSEGDAVWSPAVNATLRLIGGPLVPFRVTLQGGAGRWTMNGTHATHVPLSLGLAATIPNPALAIKPWIAPRIDVMHFSGTSIEGESVSSTDVHFGISGGVDLSLLSGLMIRGAYDRTSNDGAHPSIFSLGVGFTL